jgi:hypothetical protein
MTPGRPPPPALEAGNRSWGPWRARNAHPKSAPTIQRWAIEFGSSRQTHIPCAKTESGIAADHTLDGRTQTHISLHPSRMRASRLSMKKPQHQAGPNNYPEQNHLDPRGWAWSWRMARVRRGQAYHHITLGHRKPSFSRWDVSNVQSISRSKHRGCFVGRLYALAISAYECETDRRVGRKGHESFRSAGHGPCGR